MDKNANISFVIPAYNAGATIDEAVHSILNNNLEFGDEIIIVNDASTDNTLERVLVFKNRYPFIKIVNNLHNKGCPASRNIGVKISNNHLIFNLDADDVLKPFSVVNLKNQIVNHNADAAAFGEIHYFRKNINSIETKWICKPGIMTLADYLAGVIVPGGNFLYKKSVWKRVEGYWEWGKGIHEFWGFALKIIASGFIYSVVPKTNYYHRLSNDSLYWRESKNANYAADIATKMMLTYKDLILEDDIKYVQSSEGRSWLSKLNTRPIRVKSGNIGITGYKYIPLMSRINRVVWKAMNFLKN